MKDICVFSEHESTYILSKDFEGVYTTSKHYEKAEMAKANCPIRKVLDL